MDEARTGKAENPCVRKNDSVNTKIKYFSTFGVGISSGACFLYAFFGISARVFNNFKPVARFSHKIGARCNFPFCNAPVLERAAFLTFPPGDGRIQGKGDDEEKYGGKAEPSERGTVRAPRPAPPEEPFISRKLNAGANAGRRRRSPVSRCAVGSALRCDAFRRGPSAGRFQERKRDPSEGALSSENTAEARRASRRRCFLYPPPGRVM